MSDDHRAQQAIWCICRCLDQIAEVLLTLTPSDDPTTTQRQVFLGRIAGINATIKAAREVIGR